MKFTEDQKLQIRARMSPLADNKKEICIEYIESIIQDRGNSIEDGWIDVEEQKPKQDTTVIVFDGNQVALAHFDDYYEGEAEWQYLDGTPYKPLPIKWQPLPSAPKQPKK